MVFSILNVIPEMRERGGREIDRQIDREREREGDRETYRERERSP